MLYPFVTSDTFIPFSSHRSDWRRKVNAVVKCLFVCWYIYINGWYLKQLSIKTFLLNALIVVVWHLEHLISFYVIQVLYQLRGNEIKCDISPTTTSDIIFGNILEIFPIKFYLDRGVSWDGVAAGINHSLAVSVVRSVADLRGTIGTIRWNSTFLSDSDRSLFLLDLLKFIMPLKRGKYFRDNFIFSNL